MNLKEVTIDIRDKLVQDLDSTVLLAIVMRATVLMVQIHGNLQYLQVRHQSEGRWPKISSQIFHQDQRPYIVKITLGWHLGLRSGICLLSHLLKVKQTVWKIRD